MSLHWGDAPDQHKGSSELATNPPRSPTSAGKASLEDEQDVPASWRSGIARGWLAAIRWLRANTFAPQRVPRRWRRRFVAYLLVLLLLVVTVGVDVPLLRMFPDFMVPGGVSLLEVLLVSLVWGAGPGLVAASAGGLLNYAILQPGLPLARRDESLFEDVLVVVLGVVIAISVSQRERARREAVQLAYEAGQARQRAEELAASLARERAQSELERKRLQTVLNVLPTGVGIADAQGKLLDVNPAKQAIWGPGAPMVYSIADFGKYTGWWPATGKRLAAEEWVMARALRGEVCPGEEVEIESFDGQRKAVLQSAAPVRDETGSIVGGVVAMVDISERRRLEEALRRSEQEAAARAMELEAIFAAMADGVLVLDGQASIQRMNPAAARLVGVEALPEYSTLPYHERKRLVMPRDASGQPFADEQQPTVRVLRGETFKDLDRIIRRLDGQDIQYSVSGAPLCNDEGQVVGGVLVMHDVTERRALERRTQEALNALLVIAEALVWIPEEGAPSAEPILEAESPVMQHFAELTRNVLGCQRVGVTVVDREKNQLRLVAGAGISAQELHYWQSVVERSPLDAYPSLQEMDDLRADKVTPVDMDVPERRNFAYQTHNPIVAPMRVGERLVGMLSLSYSPPGHEYTPNELELAGAVAKLAAMALERERLQTERETARANAQALQEANRQMDTFLGMASHELRTPLATIKLTLQMIQRRLEELTSRNTAVAASVGGFLETVERCVRQEMRLERLVKDLLDVSRIRAGKLEFQLESADLGAIVRNIVAEQRELVPERTLLLEAPDDLAVPVYVDVDRVGQVVTNYLTNALKYSPATKPVTIGLRIEGEKGIVWVRDWGPGIPQEEQEHIWERFHRTPGAAVQSGAASGLGLGLYISKTIITAHHGEVGVQSVRGEGTLFWFYLPLANHRI